MRPVLTALNHLLTQSPWARERLLPHHGRHACLDFAPLTLAFTITDNGTLSASAIDATPEVTLSLPLGAAFTTAGNGLEALMAKVQVSGSADLADTLGFVFRHLRWDAEEDLSRLVGDIAAHRLINVGEKLARAPRQLANTVANHIGGYLAKDSTLLATHAEGKGFATDIQALETALLTLEARIGRLER